VIVTSCAPDVLLKLMQVFSPLETQRSYNARKSAVDDISTGGEGFRQVPLRTTSAHEGELDPNPVFCVASGPLSDPKEGEVRWQGVRLGVAVNFDCPEGSALLPPTLPRWEGGGEHGSRGVG
jgi:hypothetical protein